MKYFATLIFLLFLLPEGKAAHITGGEMFYDYLGPGTNGGKRYRVTLRLFRDENCSGCAAMPPSVSIGIFNSDNNVLVGNTYRDVPLNTTQSLVLSQLPNCITNPPNLRYSMGIYTIDVDLPANARGYAVTYQTCCRIDGIVNIPNQTGATFYTQIPGENTLLAGQTDSSPRFNTDISLLCNNNSVLFDFSATDPDGDSLIYSFCSAYNGGAARDAAFATPAAPPYASVSYRGGYTGTTPLGTSVRINPHTGIVTGTAPGAGKYVVTVCVDAFKHGIYIGTHKKDFIVTVAPCDYASAALNPEYVTCDGFSMRFANNSSSPLNQTFYWDFGSPTTPGNISTDEFPAFTFPDTGTYTIKLVVNRNLPCSDSTTALVKVYPGFFPGFITPPTACIGTPVLFSDTTSTRYGFVDSWNWDFGITNIDNDTSHHQNPTFSFDAPGNYNIRLIVTNSKGCMDTVVHQMNIINRAPFSVSNDTLICTIDTIRLQTHASTPGNVVWNPNYMISNIHAPNPLVSPDVTTTYYVNFTDNFGCTANDSVVVNVVSRVDMNLRSDTTICLGDSFIIPLQSNAVRFNWTPDNSLSDGTIKNPTATPTTTTNYRVTGHVGNCNASAQIRVQAVPYPNVPKIGDQFVCLGESITLNSGGGSIYDWRPVAYLSNYNSPTVTVSQPPNNITYFLTVRDTLGCPKPVYDTIKIMVIKLTADAGPSDTSIALGQPLQLLGSGGTNFSWSPATWLSNPDIAAPIANPEQNITYVLTVSNDIGCNSSDSIHVKVFFLEPGFYIPTAFTPDGDGVNDNFRPIAIGMQPMGVFNVYNRWGKLVYSTTNLNDKGWDGKVNGELQPTGSFVWIAEGLTYANKRIKRKGSVILLR